MDGLAAAYSFRDRALASAIAAGVSVWLARRAIKFSAKQTELLEIHNKLSVKPHLDAHNFTDHETNTYELLITNNGIGPAVLKNSRLYYKESLINSHDPLAKAIELFFCDGPEQSPGTNCEYESVAIGQYISAGRKIKVFSATNIQGETCEQFSERLQSSVRMVLDYESIYGDKFIYDSDD